mgnify:FL=1
MPSKAFLYAGKILHLAKHHGFSGIELEVKNFNFQKVVEDELFLVERLRYEKYEKVLKNLEYVTAIEGKAKFVSQNKIEVNDEKLRGEKFIIATGSTANVPSIEGIREVGFLTHIEALKMKRQPKGLIVVGAGPLGLEFAQMFSRFGTKVTILQRRDSILPNLEKELVNRLVEILTKEGIAIKTNVKIKSAKKRNGIKTISFIKDGKQEEVSGEEIVLATGKTPNTLMLGLETVGVKIDKHQTIIVNQYLQTSNPNIFAVGDVINNPLRLETTAGREGTLAAENALKDKKLSIDYLTVPYTIFTDPQLAGVGLTEEKQMKQMGVCACRTVSFENIPKAIIMRQTEGMIKMVIHPQTKQILGVHILAPNAGELIAEVMMLVKNKKTIEEVINSLPVFPTFSEAIKIVALSFSKNITQLSCCI